MKKKYKILIGILLAVTCVVSLGVYMLMPVEIEVGQVSLGEITHHFTEQGVVEPLNARTVNAPIAGTVDRVYYKSGESFPSGAILLSIDEGDLADQLLGLGLQREAIRLEAQARQDEGSSSLEQLRAQIDEVRYQYDKMIAEEGAAQAHIEAAQSAYDLAQRSYENAQELFDMGAVSQMDLDQFRANASLARSNLKSLKDQYSQEAKDQVLGQIRSLENQLTALEAGVFSIHAAAAQQAEQVQVQINQIERKIEAKMVRPAFDGVIWETLVTEGQYVMENQPVFRIYEAGDRKILVHLLAEDAAQLKIGDAAQVKTAAGETYPATVAFISAVAHDSVSSIGLTENRILVEMSVSDLPDHLGAGNQVDVVFSVLMAKEALYIPTGSIVPTSYGDGVYKIEGGRARLTPIETGVRAGGKAEVLDGLSGETSIALNPYADKVKPGARVHAAG